jgi:hypothetical protein
VLFRSFYYRTGVNAAVEHMNRHRMEVESGLLLVLTG